MSTVITSDSKMFPVTKALSFMQMSPASESTQSEPTIPNLSDINKEDQLLQRISPLFSVKKTAYGGRGCYSIGKIAEGTSLLRVNLHVGSSVVRPFRKEVCTWCFNYNDGKTMKFRLLEKLYFCSEACRSIFQAHDPDGTLASTMSAAEDLYLKCAGEISENDVPANQEELLSVFDAKWDSVVDWERRVFRMKPGKRPQYYPTVTPEDYAEIKYVISTLHNMSRCKNIQDVKNAEVVNIASKSDTRFLDELSDEDAMAFEIQAFDILQSSEMDKVKKYPYLLVSYINIYKFIRLVSPDEWLPLVTPRNVRDIIGRNLTNAFGIWSPVTQEDEEREFFGFGVYPSASFFNHSCAYNVKKIRRGAAYEFITCKDVLPGEELCISYGINGDETVEERRAGLQEWFFTCGCKKCTAEARKS